MGKRPFLQAGSVDRAPQDLVAMMVVVLYDGLTRTRARAEVARVRVRASVLLRCTEQRPRPWIEGEVISTTELAQRRTYERLCVTVSALTGSVGIQPCPVTCNHLEGIKPIWSGFYVPRPDPN